MSDCGSQVPPPFHPFLKIGTTSALLQSPGNSPVFHDSAKRTHRGSESSSAGSFIALGCGSSGPGDLNSFKEIRCSLTISLSTSNCNSACASLFFPGGGVCHRPSFWRRLSQSKNRSASAFSLSSVTDLPSSLSSRTTVSFLCLLLFTYPKKAFLSVLSIPRQSQFILRFSIPDTVSALLRYPAVLFFCGLAFFPLPIGILFCSEVIPTVSVKPHLVSSVVFYLFFSLEWFVIVPLKFPFLKTPPPSWTPFLLGATCHGTLLILVLSLLKSALLKPRVRVWLRSAFASFEIERSRMTWSLPPPEFP